MASEVKHVTGRDLVAAAIVLLGIVLSAPLILVRLLWRQSEITAEQIGRWIDDWASH